MPDTPLVSTSREPDKESQERAIKRFISPKCTATRRSTSLTNHDLFAGGYIVTSTKKIRPAILPVETELDVDSGDPIRGFVANGSNQSGMVNPQLMGDLTMSFFVVVSGQAPGGVPELFSKNTGQPFTLSSIETSAPALHAVLSAALAEEGAAENPEDNEEAPQAALSYRILCLPVALPIVYGYPVYRGPISDACVEAMERNIPSSVFWLQGVEAWNPQVHDAILADRAQLGNKCPSLGANVNISTDISPTPFTQQSILDEDDEETVSILDTLKKRLFEIQSAAKPAHVPAGMEIPAAAGDEEASIMTDAQTAAVTLGSIPRKPKIQISSFSEDEHMLSKIMLTYAGYDSTTKTIHMAEPTEDLLYVLAMQGKENRNRALASTLVTFANEAALDNDFVARKVDLPNFDPAAVANLLNSRYDPNSAWNELEIASSRRSAAFRIPFAAPDTKTVEQQRSKSEGTRTIEELLGQDTINLSKVNSSVHYNADIFSFDAFLTTMANLSSIAECLVKCDRAKLDNKKNPLFYKFCRGVSCKLTSPFGKRFMKHVDAGKHHYIFCYLAQQADTLHSLTIFPVTQPRSVLLCLSDKEQDIPKDSYEQADGRITEILERLDKIFSNTESVPTVPLAVALDNKQARHRLELAKQEEKASKRARLDSGTPSGDTPGTRQVTPAANTDKTRERKPRDTTGCVVYTGKNAFMPFVAEQDVAKRRCIPNIRTGSSCKKGKNCDNNHEKDPLKWEPSIAKAWNELIQATADLEWDPKVDQEKLKAHITKA